MGRPHPLLVEIAAGRPVQRRTPLDEDLLLVSAAEHRMTGLLWSRVRTGELPLAAAPTAILARQDLLSRSRNLGLWRALAEVQRRLGEAGIAVVIAKGVSTEVRWYSRTGERPCNDLDLVLSPRQVDRIDDVVRILQPMHPLGRTARELMTSGVLQSIDLEVDGVEVDLHTDLLKYEVPTRQPEMLFDAAVPVLGPGGVQVRALSPEHSLVHFLLHLNKDNFARLLAYADIARILATPGLNWQVVDDFAARQGLQVHLYGALHEVTSRLGLPAAAVPVPRGTRAALWQALWPSDQRLAGRAGLIRPRNRHLMIPWSAQGRLLEATTWWWRRRVLPPSALVDLYYAGTSGPYLWRLVSGRWQARRRHRQLARVASSPAQAVPMDPLRPDGEVSAPERYKTFPPKWAHIQVPTSSAAAARAALALYAPCQPAGYLTRDAAWLAIRLFGPRALPGRARALAASVPAEQWRALVDLWFRDIGPFDTLALHARPQEHRSGFAALLLREGRSVAFVRVNAGSSEAFAHEQRVLELCAASDIRSFWYPRPVAHGRVDEWSYLAMSALPAQRHVATRRPLVDVLQEIRSVLRELPKAANVPVHWTPMHGDLTPWNCRDFGRGRRALIDWEDASWGPPDADDVLFRATVAAMAGAAPGPGPAEAVDYWQQRFTARARHREREAIERSVLNALAAMQPGSG